MLNILVTGSNGQVGSEIKELSNSYSYNFFFTARDELDITNKKDIKSFISKNSINIIVNTAAYTKVDKAQEDTENASLVNAKAVKYLSQISKDNDIKLIHLSTDYVFDGTNHKPYTENDKTNPNSIYGASKLDGENEMIKINPPSSIIIRTSWVYSSFGENFVRTMLRLGRQQDEIGVIFDQVGTPTYARDLARVILQIIGTGVLASVKTVEIYNYSNEGALSWYDFAKEIMKIAKLDCKINPIESKDYPTPATRPCYSLLSKSKIKNDFNIAIPYWKDSLNECLKIMTP